LSFHKKFSPKHWICDVVIADEFTLSAAACVETLLPGEVERHALTKGHATTSVAFKIGVNGKCHITVPFDNTKVISRQDEFVIDSGMEVLQKFKEFAPIVLIGFLNAGAEDSNRELNVGLGLFTKKESLGHSFR